MEELLETYGHPDNKEALLKEAFTRKQILNFIMKVVLSLKDTPGPPIIREDVS